MKGQLRMLDFALVCLWRQKRRHGMTLAVYVFVVFILASVLMMTGALKHEASLLLSGAPELIVQRISAGRHDWIPLSHANTIEGIRGVRSVAPRFWGYYYDPPPGATYTLMGLDELPIRGAQLVEGKGYAPDVPLACVIGQGVADARLLDPDDILPVKGTDGRLYPLRVTDAFTRASALLTHDFVLVRTDAWRRIFSIPGGVATDLVVDVPNADEADTVTRKILERLPDVKVVRRKDILRTYDAVFDWRGSLVVLAFSGALASFGILACDRAAGLGLEERKNLGVLKAIGWNVSDVLKLKAWEGLSLSLIAFLTGVLAAHVHVFHYGGSVLAPLLKGWSVLFPEFHLQPHGELVQILTVFMLSVVPYSLATLVPAWKAAITDPERIMRL